MQSYGDAVIPMPHIFDEISFLVGDSNKLHHVNAVSALRPFDDEIINFLATFSQVLFRLPGVKERSDLASLAFWCRPASLKAMKNQYGDINHLIGRGVAFHIAPSNVAVNFAYSLFTGLLSGNVNIVRLPARDFEQINIICTALSHSLSLHPRVSPYIYLIRYNKKQEINNALSLLCNVRLIWGGDKTIEVLRQSPLRPRGLDLAFSDRHSFTIIDAKNYLDSPDKIRIAHNFYNDTLHSDQTACSSPGLVIWLGKDRTVSKNAQETFWQHLDRVASERYEFQPVSAVTKLMALCMISAQVDGVVQHPVVHNRLMRAQLSTLSHDSMEYRCHSGYFLEYFAASLDEVLPVCGEKCQTITYAGIEKDVLRDFVRNKAPAGVDRIVPIGQALQFSLQWDGYDLISLLSRTVVAV